MQRAAESHGNSFEMIWSDIYAWFTISLKNESFNLFVITGAAKSDTNPAVC